MEAGESSVDRFKWLCTKSAQRCLGAEPGARFRQAGPAE